MPTLSPGDGYNFQPYNYVVTPQERFTVFSNGDYQFDKYVRAFFDAFYTKRNSEQTLAPEPLVLDDEGVTVSGQNVYNPFGRDFDAVRRRLVEFGRRTFRQAMPTGATRTCSRAAMVSYPRISRSCMAS